MVIELYLQKGKKRFVLKFCRFCAVYNADFDGDEMKHSRMSVGMCNFLKYLHLWLLIAILSVHKTINHAFGIVQDSLVGRMANYRSFGIFSPDWICLGLCHT